MRHAYIAAMALTALFGTTPVAAEPITLTAGEVIYFRNSQPLFRATSPVQQYFQFGPQEDQPAPHPRVAPPNSTVDVSFVEPRFAPLSGAFPQSFGILTITAQPFQVPTLTNPLSLVAFETPFDLRAMINCGSTLFTCTSGEFAASGIARIVLESNPSSNQWLWFSSTFTFQSPDESAPVPEPRSLFLFSGGLLSLLFEHIRRRRLRT